MSSLSLCDPAAGTAGDVGSCAVPVGTPVASCATPAGTAAGEVGS